MESFTDCNIFQEGQLVINTQKYGKAPEDQWRSKKRNLRNPEKYILLLEFRYFIISTFKVLQTLCFMHLFCYYFWEESGCLNASF